MVRRFRDGWRRVRDAGMGTVRRAARRGVGAPAHRLAARVHEAGMATAEYAVGTVAAAAFAVVLYKIVTGGAVSSLVTSIVKRALTSLS